MRAGHGSASDQQHAEHRRGERCPREIGPHPHADIPPHQALEHPRTQELDGSSRFEEELMSSVAKVSTITARSNKGFDDAIEAGLARANKSLRNISGAWIKEQKVELTDGKVVGWQVTMEVTFVLDDK
jgi:flavin-binding protein dodecin